MDILSQIIHLMNKEEVRHYKLFSSRTQVQSERKDLLLFDHIRKAGEKFDEDKVLRKLYPDGDKNPYYRLKNRLISDLNKSLVLQHLEDEDNIHMFHLLSLARFFRNRNKYKVALHYIKKVEKKAIQLESFELLDFIYSELIQLSHEIVTINPEEYIRKRKGNQEKLLVHREIDDILAAVTHRLKITQNLASTEKPIFDLLEKTVEDFAQNPAIKKNTKLRFTLYQAVSRILISRHDYLTLEDYLLKMYEEFSQEDLFSRSNHDSKLQMITFLINTLYKNRKITQSLLYCEKLKQSMEEFNRLHYQKYLLFYYNGLVINYTIRDPENCVKILEDLLSAGTFKDQPFYEFLFLTNLSVTFFSLKRYKKALKTLFRAYIHDGFSAADPGLKLKISVFELILQIEINDFETVKKRLEKVRKENDSQLLKPINKPEAEILGIIEEINDSINYKADKTLVLRAKTLVSESNIQNREGHSFIGYREWLIEKFNLGKV